MATAFLLQILSESPSSTALLIFSIVIGLLILILQKASSKPSNGRSKDPDVEVAKPVKSEVPEKKAAKKDVVKEKPSKGFSSSHPNVVNTLKGHTDEITSICFSSDGNLIASTSLDRTARIYALTDLQAKDFKFQRLNLELDHGVASSFSSDAKNLLVALHTKKIQAFAIKYSASTNSFTPTKMVHQSSIEEHKSEIIAMALSPDGKYIMTCAEEGNAIVWEVKGTKLDEAALNSLGNHMACLSPDGRFLTAATFTADVKIFGVNFGKTGSFEGVKKAMALRGHKSAVYCVCFSAFFGNRVGTVSKDKTWRLWDINVRWEVDEDPKCVLTVPTTIAFEKIAMSPDSAFVALAVRSTLHVYAVTWDANTYSASASLVVEVERAHEGDITALEWSPSSPPNMVLATASRDRRVRLWRF